MNVVIFLMDGKCVELTGQSYQDCACYITMCRQAMTQMPKQMETVLKISKKSSLLGVCVLFDAAL